MEEMYEVLKFIEHGAQCRQSMDCERGDLLIFYLRDNPQQKKEVLFDWFRQISISLDQFHRCRKGQRYRYLNPYSIVVGEDGKVYLLDLEAPENETVIKKMQNRAVRKHFVKRAGRTESGTEGDVDLFGYGRTIQFVLAYTEAVPGLSRREEKRMVRVIERCTEFCRKRYSDIRQVTGDIPVTGKCRPFPRLPGWKKKVILTAGCLGVLAALTAVLPEIAGSKAAEKMHSAEEYVTEEENPGNKTAEAERQISAFSEYNENLISDERITDEEYIAAAGRILKTYLLQNTVEGNEQTLLLGRELELDVVRSLAAAYERQEMTEEAILAYGRLLEIEEGTGRIEEAAEKKMKLEAGQGQYAQAVLTGENALKKAENSESLFNLTEKYRQELEGENAGNRNKQSEGPASETAGREQESEEEESNGKNE